MQLEIKNLWVSYDGAEAMRDLSAGLDEGEIVCLIGSNGAGKSTLMHTICGLKTPDTGEILYDGQHIEGLPAHKIVQIGISLVPEGRRIFQHMSVFENLIMGAYTRTNRGTVEKDLTTVYEHFQVLEKRKNQMAGSLSGGEQQMLAVARSLMSKPKLLLLDEPSLGLAPMMVQEIARIIKRINATGVSIMLAEQNARLALQLSSRAYVIEKGCVTLTAPSAELMINDHVRKSYLGG